MSIDWDVVHDVGMVAICAFCVVIVIGVIITVRVEDRRRNGKR